MACRYRLYPTAGQAVILEQHCAHARTVWNAALEQLNWWRPGRTPSPGRAERDRQLADARREIDWLAAGSSSVQQQALRDFARACTNWWAGTHGRPTWRKRGRNDGFCVRDVNVCKLNGRWAQITVPKAGAVRFRLSRPLPDGPAGMARVTLDGAGRWHISFPGGQPAVSRQRTGAVVGVDRGVTATLALSDGRVFKAPVMRSKEHSKLTGLQQRLARQRKGSKRREDTKRRIAALHQSVADRRRNWIEVQTTRLVCEHDLIAVENLPVASMVRCPKPKADPDTPGGFLPNGRAAKAGLNRAIHQQGWSMWLRRLEQKAEASGVQVVKIPAAYTSQTCRKCGHIAPENRESQAAFRCVMCGHEQNADLNAAQNILARALELAPTPGQGANPTSGSAETVARISRPRTRGRRENSPGTLAHAA
jgi:putative transposase